MSETMDKAKLKFEVRAQKDPTDPTKTIFVPAIIERNDPMSLAGVIYNAIDTGRIAGLKPNAAKAIAEGICDQMYQEILKGNGIDARIVATWPDGQTAYINAKFHDDSE